MRTIPQQYIRKDDYPEGWLDSEYAQNETAFRAMQLQYDRWVDDLLGRIVDLEDHIEHLKNQVRIAVDTLEDNFNEVD